MRLIVIAFSFLYVVQSKLLGLLLQATRALEPLEKLNLVIQMKKKIRQYKKARIYFEMLTEPVPELQTTPYTTSYVDFHLHKLSVYIKFCSQATQLVVDIALGILFLVFIYRYPKQIFKISNRFGSNLHLEDI